MSVQDGLLAVLSIAPAYGSQLQAELAARAPHRGRINAGQIHATLERMSNRGIVTSAGLTDDGLPLYRLTAAGSRDARDWLSGDVAGVRRDWDDMQDHVLVAASVAGARPLDVVARYEEAWAAEAELSSLSRGVEAVRRARALVAEAALAWLAEVRTALTRDPAYFVVERAIERPRRGRPVATPTAVAG
jgi:DNA-binding PadR family transcriptional regulator